MNQLQFGPYHPALPGPLRLNLRIEGERIAATQVETGFAYKGLERILATKTWVGAIPYADHVDPEAALFGELCYVIAVEEIAGIKVPKRGNAVRLVLSELTRLGNHLRYVAVLCGHAGANTVQHLVLRDREKVIDLIELLTGSRFNPNFIRLGGVVADVSEGFAERVLEVCDLLTFRSREYNELLGAGAAFLGRTRGVGTLSLNLCNKFDITGPNLRSAGGELDIRKSKPYCGVDQYRFAVAVPVEGGENLGDIYLRFSSRLKEILQSTALIRQVIETLPQGEFAIPAERIPAIPKGEATSYVESPRGRMSCRVVSDGGDGPALVEFKTPSQAVLAAVPEVLRGAAVEDLSITLASLDISVAEVDK